jgi:restriction system protein
MYTEVSSNNGTWILLELFFGAFLGYMMILGFTVNKIYWMIGALILIIVIIIAYYKYLESEEKKGKLMDLMRQKQVKEERIREIKKRELDQFEAEQRAKGLQKVIHMRTEVWATPEQIKEWKYIEVDLENNFQKLTPQQFERAIADLFKKMKYDVEVTQYTGDYGADIIIKKDNSTSVVQCKRYAENHKVGAPDVQMTLGSMYRYNASKAILVTTSDYTKQARTQARTAPIELWNARKLREEFEKAYLKSN